MVTTRISTRDEKAIYRKSWLFRFLRYARGKAVPPEERHSELLSLPVIGIRAVFSSVMFFENMFGQAFDFRI